MRTDAVRMDLLAIVLALTFFVALLALIDGIDRV